jgi:transglutaminase-like putative cysteine protease
VLSVPPFVLAGALLLWGTAAGFGPAAVALALLVEAARYSAWRFELRVRDFERIADLCAAALAAALLYALSSAAHFSEGLVATLRWLPLLFAPLILAQRLSSAGSVPLSALFWSLRRGRSAATVRPPAAAEAPHAGNVDFAYLGACLLAAAAANLRAPWFYAALGMLLLIALWPQRKAGGARFAWPVAAAAALALGFGIQAALTRMQSALEDAALQWLDARWQAQADPYRTRTAIGDIGTLKASDRIVLRVDVDAAARDAPPLLRHATYTRYVAGAWSAPAQPFRALVADADGWVLAPGAGSVKLRVSGWTLEGRALLALPASTVRVDGLAAADLQTNGMGAVRVEDGPQPLLYEAWYEPETAGDAPPGREDLVVPAALAAPMREVADTLALRAAAPGDAVSALQSFFNDRFEYSLDLDAPGGSGRSLVRFLTQDRRGHCEYFATATVLLLRAAGIPARYATGYSVQEWSEIEQRYVVRARHAHAWVLAWVDGRWREVDTTPAVWAQEDAQRASALQMFYDIASALHYRISLWRTGDDRAGAALPVWTWLAVPLAGYLLWRLWRRRARRKSRRAAVAMPADAGLAALLRRLARLGYERPPGTPLLAWVRALPLDDREMRAQLENVVRDYYRTRFAVHGAPVAADREADLEAGAATPVSRPMRR